MAKFTDDVEDKTYTYTYDLSDRLIESYRSDNAYVRQSFNAQNLTSGVKFGFGGTSGTASYTYNAGLDNAPANATFSGAGKENFFYDALGRTTATYVYNGSNANVMHTDYTYKDKDSVQTSGVVSRVRNVYNSTVFSDYTYTYDANGNITLILTGDGDRIQYTYDNLNRLTRCDDEVNEKTWTYTYDKKGNITCKKTYTCYAIGQVLDTPDATVNYTYGDSNWADLFTSYNNLPIAYDAIGNMTSFYGRTLTWSGRRLATFSYNGTTASYTYNSDGIRTSKTVNGTKTEFFLNGTQILAQKTGSNTPMVFYYDHNGKRVAFRNTDGAVYFYVYNLQGDVVQILDSSRNIVGEYQYDPYGKVQNTLSAIAKANPFRYRGYYFDSENGYYYLNARYYYPVFGRFISADEIIAQTSDFTGCNVFAYCKDNPIIHFDHSGFWTKGITISFNFNFLVGAMYSVGLFWDEYGNKEWQQSYAFGAQDDSFSFGLFDIGVGAAIQKTDRDTIYDLYGLAEVYGASFGDVICGGADILSFDNKAINGVQVTLGPGLGADIHYMSTYTKPLKNNRTAYNKRNKPLSVGKSSNSYNYSTSYTKNKMVACFV